MNSLYVALACAGVSYTITCTSVFKWFRESIGVYHKKLDELVHCPWCLNHYVCLMALLVSRGTIVIISDYIFIDFLFTWFFMVTLGGIIHYVLLRSYEPILKATIQRQLERLQNGQHTKERQHNP